MHTFLLKAAKRIEDYVPFYNKEQLLSVTGAYAELGQSGGEQVFALVEKELKPQILTNLSLYEGLQALKYFSKARQGSS